MKEERWQNYELRERVGIKNPITFSTASLHRVVECQAALLVVEYLRFNWQHSFHPLQLCEEWK